MCGLPEIEVPVQRGKRMEELRSTEILDKEIRSDARKKAERILSKAEVDCQMILAEVDDRVENAKKEISDKDEKKLAAYEKQKNAALPLEKKRFLVNFIQTAINRATDEFLQKLTEKERLELVLKPLEKKEGILKSKKVRVSVYGFDSKMVQEKLDKKLDVDSYSQTEFNKMIVENDCGLTRLEGVIVESCDKAVRCRFTLSEAVSQMQYKYRAELCDALFGGRL